MKLRLLALGAVAVIAASAIAAAASTTGSPTASSLRTGITLYVDPKIGDDAAPGSATAPLRTIQAALNEAAAGTVIRLAPGRYVERPFTRVDGRPGAPITIEGPESGWSESKRFHAVLYTTGHGFTIQHSYYRLRGFTIDGQQAVEAAKPRDTWPRNITGVDKFKDGIQDLAVDDRLLYVGAASGDRAVRGTIIANMYLTAAGDECVHLLHATTQTVIRHSVIRWCGMRAKPRSDAYSYHNGEGVYIGTSPKSTSDPMHLSDTASYNRVVNSRIRTFGSECFDVKENAHHNTLARSRCGDNTEPGSFSGSNVELRGHDNRVVRTTISNGAGVGVKVSSDSETYPLAGNTIVDNSIVGQSGPPFYISSRAGQLLICGNTVDDTQKTEPAWLSACP